MPLSFRIISAILFVIVSSVSIFMLIRHYRKELKHEWQQQKPLNVTMLLRGAVPLCVVITAAIMLAVRYIFFLNVP
jgi:hypothetical protein